MGKSANRFPASGMRHFQGTECGLRRPHSRIAAGGLPGGFPDKWHDAEEREILTVSSALGIPEGRPDVK